MAQINRKHVAAGMAPPPETVAEVTLTENTPESHTDTADEANVGIEPVASVLEPGATEWRDVHGEEAREITERNRAADALVPMTDEAEIAAVFEAAAVPARGRLIADDDPAHDHEYKFIVQRHYGRNPFLRWAVDIYGPVETHEATEESPATLYRPWVYGVNGLVKDLVLGKAYKMAGQHRNKTGFFSPDNGPFEKFLPVSAPKVAATVPQGAPDRLQRATGDNG